MSNTIVIIGGGAVGMLTAIHLDKYFPQFKVVVIELRSTFTRKQIILINQESRGMLPQEVLHNIWGKKGHEKGCYVLAPSKDRWARCYSGKLPLASVELKILEKELYYYIQKYTNVMYLKPKSGKAAIKMRKDISAIVFEGENIQYDMLLAADGANSWVANNLNIKRIPILTKKYYGLVVNINKKSRSPKSNGYFDKASEERIKIVEHQKPQNDWRFFKRRPNGFYIGLIIDHKEYENLHNNKLTNKIKKKIQDICQEVNTKCDIKIKDINVFPVEPSYLSEIRTTGPNNTDIFFLGDALVSTHYFTGSGINVGFNSVKVLISFLKSDKSLHEYDVEQMKNIEIIKEKTLSISQ
jgi:2-polyprenyl-6-methoxyphenol hydroxylase-like FAD-dependent oxidoreductase